MIEQAIEPVKSNIVRINKQQLMISIGGDDKPLIHKKTGSPFLSPAYAKKKKKKKPNLYDTGDYQREMDLEIYNLDEYAIVSYDWKHPILTENYPNLAGVAPSNRKQAYAVTTPAIRRFLNEKVFK